jgi:hypothetical protein
VLLGWLRPAQRVAQRAVEDGQVRVPPLAPPLENLGRCEREGGWQIGRGARIVINASGEREAKVSQHNVVGSESSGSLGWAHEQQVVELDVAVRDAQWAVQLLERAAKPEQRTAREQVGIG